MRTITVVLQVHDQKAADVYWESFKHPFNENFLVNGCTVQSVGNGDAYRDFELAKALLSEEQYKALYIEISKINSEEFKCQSQAESEKKNEPQPPSTIPPTGQKIS